MVLKILRLGLRDYKEALDIQEKLMALRRNNSIGDTLILVEHPPVITLGRRGNRENIIVPKQMLDETKVSIYEVTRGGDVTYHGPGQIVGYPIMDLNNHSKDIKQFVSNIEEVFIRLLADNFAITAHRDEKKYTGVWVENEKITAIGIAVKHWVTMHGFAFNVNTDLSHFEWINPCGITDKGVTSLEKLTGQNQDFSRMQDMVTDYFCKVFDMTPEFIDMEDWS